MSIDKLGILGSGLTFPDLDLNPVISAPEPTVKRPLLTRMDGSSHDWVLQIDNTTMSQFQTCPRSAQHYCIDRRQRPDRSPLIFGGAIHAALEQHYKGNGIRAAVEAMAAYFEKHPVVQHDEWRTPSYAAQALKAYLQHWDLMDNLVPVSEEWVEKAFALNIGSFDIKSYLPYTYAQLSDEDDHEHMYVEKLHIQWTGKIDVVTRSSDGVLFVCDHKTSSMGGPTFFADFELAQQTHGYCWAVQKMMNERVGGFILNALLIRKPTKTGVGMEFDRKTYFYSQESMTEWHKDTLASVESFVHSLTAGFFPKYTAWCMGKYGKCQYHDVCILPTNQQKLMLSTDQFSNVTWSPLLLNE